MITAIIPAKGNSEEVPNKNFKKLAGRELIRHTLSAAVGSKLIDEVYITTDVAKGLTFTHSDDLDVTFLNRPPELTLPSVQVDEVVLYSLRQMQVLGHCPTTIVVLQPTSPFRASKHIDEAIEMYQELKLVQHDEYPDTVFSAKESGYAYEMYGGEAEPIGHIPSQRLGRQDADYDSVVVEHGAIYVVDAKKLSQQRTIRGEVMVPYLMDEISSFEIDSQLDWDIAEVMVKHVNHS